MSAYSSRTTRSVDLFEESNPLAITKRFLRGLKVSLFLTACTVYGIHVRTCMLKHIHGPSLFIMLLIHVSRCSHTTFTPQRFSAPLIYMISG